MVFDIVKKLIAEQFSVDEETITLDTEFLADLCADSLDAVEFIMAIEEEFDLDDLADEDVESFRTVGDVVAYLKNRVD